MDGSQYGWSHDAGRRQTAWWRRRMHPGTGLLWMLVIASVTFGAIVVLEPVRARIGTTPFNGTAGQG